MTLVLAEADVLERAFTRREPDLLIIHQVTGLIRERRLMIPGWVRHALLRRTRDARNLARLAHVLAGFPTPRLHDDDHAAAALLEMRLREQGQAIQPHQALTWVVARRLALPVWSRDRIWSAFVAQGGAIYEA